MHCDAPPTAMGKLKHRVELKFVIFPSVFVNRLNGNNKN